MFHSRLTLFATFFLFIFNFWSCQENQEPADYLYLQGVAQGSTFNIQIDSQDTTLKEAVLKVLTEQDTIFSLYRPQSYIKRINAEKRAEYNKYFARVLEVANEIRIKSKGYFNPNVYQLFKYADTAEVLNDSILKMYQKNAVQFDYEINDSSIILGNNMQLTFDAIAQGYTVDVIVELLESRGISNYFVEVGGELSVKGQNAYGDHWTVGVEHPSQERRGVFVRKLGLKQGAVASSGNYRKFLNGDKSRPHTIDPHTGKPKETDIIACTVISDKAIYADAYATAIMAMDLEEREQFIEKEGLVVFTISLKGDKISVKNYNGVEDYMEM